MVPHVAVLLLCALAEGSTTISIANQICCACSDLGTHLSHAHLLTLADIDTVSNAAQGAAQEAANAGAAATSSGGGGPFDALAKVLESALTVRAPHCAENSSEDRL